jgi:ABC-type phosphate transport system substrate-binding protein
LIYAEKFHHKGVGNMAKVWGVLLGCAMFLGMIGCGGSSSSSTPIPTPTPGTGTATVSASSTTIPLSAVQQFTAANFSSAVTWSLNPAIGSIDAQHSSRDRDSGYASCVRERHHCFS